MKIPETRLPFRILAGMTGLFLLLFGLPVSLLGAQAGSLSSIFFAVCCFIGGIGLVTAAYTGRWFNSPA